MIRSVAAIITATANLSAVVRKQATRRVAAFFAALHDCDHLTAAAATATQWLKHIASHKVVALRISASGIVNAATLFYAASPLHVLLFMREKMCGWLALAKKKMWLWIASFGDSYDGVVLQLANQLFSLRFLQMTKYCIMRECYNFLSGYLSVLTTIQYLLSKMEFMVLNSPRRFSGDPFLRSHSFTLLFN